MQAATTSTAPKQKIVIQCCRCKRVSRDRLEWFYFLPEANANDAEISHGYCPQCFLSAYAELTAFIGRRAEARAPVSA